MGHLTNRGSSLVRVLPAHAKFVSPFLFISAWLLRQTHEQETGESPLTKNAFKILYATDDDHEAAPEIEDPLSPGGGPVCVYFAH